MRHFGVAFASPSSSSMSLTKYIHGNALAWRTHISACAKSPFWRDHRSFVICIQSHLYSLKVCKYSHSFRPLYLHVYIWNCIYIEYCERVGDFSFFYYPFAILMCALYICIEFGGMKIFIWD